MIVLNPKRAHRHPKAGRPEMRTFLRRQPLQFPTHEHPPIEAPRPKEARAAKGPRVSPQSKHKRRRLDVRTRRRLNRGAYSGQ